MSDEDRYQAAAMLAAIGDVLGSRGGAWRLCKSGFRIHQELEELGGLDKLELCPEQWPLSGNTFHFLASGEALSHCLSSSHDVVQHYLASFDKNLHELKSLIANETKDVAPPPCWMRFIPFAFVSVQSDWLIPSCIAIVRAMSNDSVDALNSVAVALLTSFAVQLIPVVQWGAKLLTHLDKIRDHLEQNGFSRIDDGFQLLKDRWVTYLESRGLVDGKSDAVFPSEYEIIERDWCYSEWSLDSSWSTSGFESILIAYDALLASGSDWTELCRRSMFHAGSGDVSGLLAGCWHGLLFGASKVPDCIKRTLHASDRLADVGKRLFELRLPTELSALCTRMADTTHLC